MVWPPYKRAYEAAHMTVEEMDIKGTKLANDHTASGWWNLNVNLDRLQILYPSNPWSKLRKNEREKRRKEGKKEEEQRERKRCTHRAMICFDCGYFARRACLHTHMDINWDSQFQLAVPCGLTFSIPLSFIKKCWFRATKLISWLANGLWLGQLVLR